MPPVILMTSVHMQCTHLYILSEWLYYENISSDRVRAMDIL
jgi:hypothetical protein